MAKNRKKRKDYILSFRVSEKDYFELLKIADENQMSISEIIRDAIRNCKKKLLWLMVIIILSFVAITISLAKKIRRYLIEADF